MRMMTALSLALVGVAGLAACSESDEAFRASYRTEAIAQCVRGANSGPNRPAIDPNRFCTCMVDRYMQGTTSDRLRAERSQNEPPPAAQTAITQCMREITGAGAPADGNEQAEAPEAEAGENEQ